MKIKDLNNQERPREKLLSKTPSNLTNEELLAVILRSGSKDISAITVAREIFKKYRNFKALLDVEIEELLKIKSIGIAKATSIKAVGEIALRTINENTEYKPMTKPQDVYTYVYEDLFGKTKEYLYLISLNAKNIPIAKDVITIGTINQTIVSSRDIYKKALGRNAASIILVHNHPSNDTTPSPEDIKVTEEIAEIGKKIDIPLLDHLIFSDTKYTSLKALNLFNTYKFNLKGGE